MLKTYLMKKAIEMILAALSGPVLREVADKILDIVEDNASALQPGVTKQLLDSGCATLREAFNIPDND